MQQSRPLRTMCAERESKSTSLEHQRTSHTSRCAPTPKISQLKCLCCPQATASRLETNACDILTALARLFWVPSLGSGQELVHLLKPALVHDDRSIEDSCLFSSAPSRKLRSRQANKGEVASMVGRDVLFTVPAAPMHAGGSAVMR